MIDITDKIEHIEFIRNKITHKARINVISMLILTFLKHFNLFLCSSKIFLHFKNSIFILRALKPAASLQWLLYDLLKNFVGHGV